MSDIIQGMPNIFYKTSDISKLSPSKENCYAPLLKNKFKDVQSCFGIALHMHQPTIPAATNDLRTSRLISNLQNMMENQHIGDNHNAPVFMNCYERMSGIIRSFVDRGCNPRVMLDYSGNLLWGLRQMENGRVLESLKEITKNKKYFPNVEWLGTTWSHAVATSTPVPDIKIHLMAWRKHFASIFGAEAVKRVKGFSPPEMHLPIHPDVCYEYVKALKECGYQWIMVQEHTIENLDGSGIKRPHLPHKLIAKNSLGDVEEITVLIKTQGSDTKLVAQMQPYYEAKTLNRLEFCGQKIPPFVCQIGDGENGGVMMNEFPPSYDQAFNEIGLQGTVAMNGSEYLENLEAMGISETSFTPIQPISQHKIWKVIKVGTKSAADEAIKKIHQEDNSFNLDKGSWTSDKNWVKGYESVMDPMNKLSALFHKKFDKNKQLQETPHYMKAKLYLLLSQTSCFRYWGEGIWTEYAKELCQRGFDALN